MKKLNYTLYNGKQKQVEVTDEVFDAYIQMEKQMKSNDKRETRKHISLEHLEENNFEIEDESSNPFDILSEKFNNAQLKIAISQLSPAQQSLLGRVYFMKETLTDIAKEFGVSRNAIVHQMDAILCRIKEKIRIL